MKLDDSINSAIENVMTDDLNMAFWLVSPAGHPIYRLVNGEWKNCTNRAIASLDTLDVKDLHECTHRMWNLFSGKKQKESYSIRYVDVNEKGESVPMAARLFMRAIKNEEGVVKNILITSQSLGYESFLNTFGVEKTELTEMQVPERTSTVTDSLTDSLYIEHIHKMLDYCSIKLYYVTPGVDFLWQEDPLDPVECVPFAQVYHQMHPDDVEIFKGYVARCHQRVQQKGEFHFRMRMLGDNLYHRFKGVVMPVLNSRGELEKYAFIRIDESNKFTIQEMLRLSQQVGQIGAWVRNSEDDELQWTDQTFHIFGLPVTADNRITQADFVRCMHPDDVDDVLQQMDKNVALRSSDVVNFRIITPAGVEKMVEMRMNVQEKGSDGSIIVYGTLMDITERKLIIEEKNKVESLFYSVMKSLPLMVYVKDVEDEFRIVEANDRYINFFGRSYDEIIGQKESEFAPDSVAVSCLTNDLISMHHTIDNPFTNILQFQDKKGNDVVFQNVKFVQNVQGKRLLLGVSWDITELQMAKARAEQSDQLKSAFLANMSHEIRTPLNAIVGFSEMIVNGESPDQNDMFVEMINSNSQHLLRLINDILDLSRLESNIITFENNKFSLNKMMETACQSVKQAFNDKGIKLELVLLAHDAIAYQDELRVSEVLNNFLTNALKNTAQGMVKVWAEVDDEAFTIHVSDTGKGIPSDKLDAIFNRFEKLDYFAKGTGLGLSICQAIATALQGKLGVTSTVGKGSTFSMTLPLRAEQ